MSSESHWTADWGRRLDGLHPAMRWLIALALAVVGVAFLVTVAAFSAAVAFLHAAPRFPRPPYRQPSRLYGQPTHLAVGSPYEARLLADELAGEGYREVVGAGEADGAAASAELPAGAYRRGKDSFAVHLRRFPTVAGTGGGGTVEATFAAGRVAALAVGGRAMAGADGARGVDLEPPLLASYYGPDVEERVPVALGRLPDYVPRAVLAAEDSGFYDHPGVSVAGILRAAWVDLSGGAVEQGGSTLTQQLVKNLYLTQRRTLSRKAREVFLAFLVELRHDKREILEAYLNEIYWGKSGPANLIGLGAAARAYFGKDAASLSLAEAAALAGMIRSPGDYSPREHPERAIDRRNVILRRMVELGWARREGALAAAGEPLPPPAPAVTARRIAPYFADAAAEEAAERFGLKELADRGCLLFSTLRFGDQRRAEESVAAGLDEIEKGPERHSGRSGRSDGGRLQSALVSTDPRDGAILAYVGGRDYGTSQFDRVAHARRQAGSAWKPVVYAAAFADAVAAPATYLEDSPIVVRYGAERWSPQDYDRAYRGWVTARTALEQSLNVPAVRLALSVGLGRVVELARAMGIEAPLATVPSLALGAFAVTPREMAAVYSTLADGGSRPPLHALVAVRDGGGDLLPGNELPPPHRVLEPQAAYLVTSVLQGVLDRGTGQAARRQGVEGALAGKTGTTNGRRDSWFAGYSPDRATVVWVGYDDDSASHLSGSSAALPIWSRFTAAVRPAGGYPEFVPPPGLVTATVDPTTGQLATAACPVVVTDLFAEWRAPRETCAQHAAPDAGAWRAADLAAAGAAPDPSADPALAQPAEGTWKLRGLPEAPAGPAAAAAAPAGQVAPGTIVIRPTAHPRPVPPAPATDGGEDESPAPSAEASPPPPRR
jgi:penicillin-binding protein 1B